MNPSKNWKFETYFHYGVAFYFINSQIIQNYLKKKIRIIQLIWVNLKNLENTQEFLFNKIDLINKSSYKIHWDQMFKMKERIQYSLAGYTQPGIFYRSNIKLKKTIVITKGEKTISSSQIKWS